jgi:hypothetical protein
MKKIIITLAVFLFSGLSAQAMDRSMFSVTAGLAANQSVYGASGTETNRGDTNLIADVKKESGVFTDGHQSGFIELNVGDYVSFGFEHTADGISTPENKSREGRSVENKVSVDFNDLNTTYVKINLPVLTGTYFRFGYVETDIDVKETSGSGKTYSNASTEGSIVALGFAKGLGESRFSLRFEGAYMDLDNVSSNNGIAADAASVANSGRNQIDVSNMEGLTGKIALTLTLGK